MTSTTRRKTSSTTTMSDAEIRVCGEARTPLMSLELHPGGEAVLSADASASPGALRPQSMIRGHVPFFFNFC